MRSRLLQPARGARRPLIRRPAGACERADTPDGGLSLWNAVNPKRVVSELRSREEEVPDEYLRHLSPLEWEYTTPTGVYGWDLGRHGALGRKRP